MSDSKEAGSTSSATVALTVDEHYQAFNDELKSFSETMDSVFGDDFPEVKATGEKLTAGLSLYGEDTRLLAQSAAVAFFENQDLLLSSPPNEKFILEKGLPQIMADIKWTKLWSQTEPENKESIWIFLQNLYVLLNRIFEVDPNLIPKPMRAAHAARIQEAKAKKKLSQLASTVQATQAEVQSSVDKIQATLQANPPNPSNPITATPLSLEEAMFGTDAENASKKKQQKKRQKEHDPVQVFEEVLSSPEVQEMVEMAGENFGGEVGADGQPTKPVDKEQLQKMMSKLAGTLEGFSRKMDPNSKPITEEQRAMRVRTLEHQITRVTGIQLHQHTDQALIMQDIANEARAKETSENKEVMKKCAMVAHFHTLLIELLDFLYVGRAIRHENDHPCFKNAKIAYEAFKADLKANPLTEFYLDACIAIHRAFKHQFSDRDPTPFLKMGVPEGQTESVVPYFKEARSDLFFRSLKFADKEIVWPMIAELSQFIEVISSFKTTALGPLREVIESVMAFNRFSATQKDNEGAGDDLLFKVMSNFSNSQTIPKLKEAAMNVITSGSYDEPLNLFLATLPQQAVKRLGFDPSTLAPRTVVGAKAGETPSASASAAAPAKPAWDPSKLKVLESFLFKKRKPVAASASAPAVGSSEKTDVKEPGSKNPDRLLKEPFGVLGGCKESKTSLAVVPIAAPVAAPKPPANPEPAVQLTPAATPAEVSARTIKGVLKGSGATSGKKVIRKKQIAKPK